MSGRVVVRRLPDGAPVELPAAASIGCAEWAKLRIVEPHISGSHAEISPREGGITLIACRGDVRVDGRSVKEALVEQRQRWWFAPGIEYEVLDVVPEVPEKAVKKTAPDFSGAIAYRAIATGVRAATPVGQVQLGFKAAKLLRMLLESADRCVPWDEVAAALWPEDAALRQRDRRDWDRNDLESGYKNRLHGQVRDLNDKLQGLRGERMVRFENLLVTLAWREGDSFER